MLALVVLEGVVLAVLAVLVVGLLRTHAEILRRLHELGAGLFDDELPSGGQDPGTQAGGRQPGSWQPSSWQPDAGRPEGRPRSGSPAPVVTSAASPDDAPPVRTRPGIAPPRPTATGAHDLVGVAPDGAATAVGVVGAGHTTLLAFLSSGCGTCAGFWEAFRTGAGTRLPGRDTRLVVVTRSPEHESQSAVQALAPPSLTTVMSTAAFEDYAVPVNPYFILVDGPSGGIVGEGAAATWDQVANLLSRAAADAGLADRRRRDDVTGSRRALASERGPARGLDSRQRDTRAEAELAAAGIGPGHPSLYPDRAPRAGPAPSDAVTSDGAAPTRPAPARPALDDDEDEDD